MRKLKLQVQISVDGYIAGPDGEMDWMVWDWNDDINKYVNEITEPVDTIILGRKLAEGFIPVWATRLDNPETADNFARKMVETHKVVFTKSMDESGWENTTLAKGDFVDEIKKLKQQEGKDIIAYGGSAFVSSLIKEGLIDEYHLFVNPAALGHGMPIFQSLKGNLKLKLVNSTAFDCSIVVLHYEPLQ